MSIKIEKDNSINISFDEGIGQSSLSSFSDMMGVDIEDNPGSVSSNFKFNRVIETITNKTVTFNDTTSKVTLDSGSILYRGTFIGTPVVFSTTGALPIGITAGTVYYVSSLSSPTGASFQISDTLKKALDGSAFTALGGAGTGTHTMTIITPSDITGYTKNGDGKLFVLDSLQRVWFNASDGVNSAWYLLSGNTGFGVGDGNGIIYYKGYILVFYSSGVDALKDIDSPSDTLEWDLNFCNSIIGISSSMANGGKGAVPFLSVNDDAVYFSNGLDSGYRVGMIEGGSSFDPSSSTTFSAVADVIKLPVKNGRGFATAIKELNELLIIGTYSDEIYFWDKKSPSFTTHMQMPEIGVCSIETVGEFAYIFIENSGSIYVCNTSSFSPLLKLPDYITNDYYNFVSGLNVLKINSSAVHKRDLLFSLTIADSSTSSNYLMSYNLDSKKLTKKNISSFGETGDRSGSYYGKINSIIPFNKNIFIGSSFYTKTGDVFEYAIESLHYLPLIGSGSSNYYVYDNYEPNIITGLISYGDVYNKKTVKELSVSLLRPLEANQGIKVYYRRNDNGAWTELKTIDYTNNGGIKDIKTPSHITDIIDIQFKIEISGIDKKSPRLKSIRLIP